MAQQCLALATIENNDNIDDKEVFLTVLQFLRDQNMTRTAHMMERESAAYFDMEYFGKVVYDGDFDEAENYVSGFTNIHENMQSTRIYFELRRQKYLEALDRNDKAKALDILTKEIKEFSPYNDKICNEAVVLIHLDNIREHPSLAMYGDSRIERVHVVHAVRKYFEDNPAFVGKLNYPFRGKSNLRQIIHQAHSAGAASGTRPPVSFH